MNQKILVLNSVTASGADCVPSSDGTIYITGLDAGSSFTLPFKTSWVKDFSITTGAADTPAVWTSSTTATASTLYQIRIDGTNKLTKQPDSWLSPSYTSASSTSKTAINTVFVNWVNSLGDDFPATAALVATEFVITADTSYPEFTVTNVGTGLTGVTETTTGVASSGVGADIIEVGQYTSDDVVSSNVYTTVEIDFVGDVFTGNQDSLTQSKLILYVNQGDTDYPTLVGYNSTLGIGYGTLASVLYNNRIATYSAVGDTVAVASLVATRGGGSFFTENIKGGDLFVINTGASAVPALIDVPYTDGATAANLIFDKATVTGADIAAAAALLVKFTNLPA